MSGSGSPLVEAFLLGTAQDGGLPHCGCHCDNCSEARSDSSKRQFPAALAIIDHLAECYWIIDATPEFPRQLELLEETFEEYDLAGLLITHTHIGHYTGLVHCGKEVMSTWRLPLLASPKICSFLQENAPWSQLVDLENLQLFPVEPDQPVELSPQLSIVPVQVPHRDEYSDTLAFIIEGPDRRLFYCPDIDRWEDWDRDLTTFLEQVDVALVDGTFFDDSDLSPGRRESVPHPAIMETIARLDEPGAEVVFVHLNHSSPLFGPGPERNRVIEKGFGVGVLGARWTL